MTFGAALGRLAFGIVLNGVVAWGAIRLARAVSSCASGRAALAPSALVFGVALVTVTVTLDGIAGVLNRPWAVLATAAAASGVAAWAATRLAHGAAPARLAPCLGGFPRGGTSVVVSALLVAVAWIPLACDRLALPPVAWDSLTYHLQFPVLWLQTGRLVTSTPAIGDPAHTYYPLGGEMLLYWMLRSTGSDLLAFVTQIPFALLGAWAVATIALRCGARREGAWLAALAWLGTPALLRQAVDPLVDIETASLFLGVIALGSRARPDGAVRGFLPAAACVGLLVGAKYSGVLFAAAALPVLAGAAASGRLPPRAWVGMIAAALGAVFVLGGFAYVRNIVSGGTPFLPLQIPLAGRAAGAGSLPLDRYFGPAARRLGWGSLLVSPRSVLELGFTFTLLLASFPAALLVGRRRTGPTGRRLVTVAASGLLAFGLAALLLPFREHRYFFAVTGLGWSVVAALARSRSASSWLRVAVPGVLLLQLPVTLFYWAKDAVLAGATWRHAIAAILVAAAVVIAVRAVARRRAAGQPGPARVRLPRGALVASGVALLLLLAAGTSAYESHRYTSWTRYWSSRFAWGSFGSARQDLADAAASWKFVADATRTSPAVIAIAGSNLPYPLAGYGRRNRVLFAPRNGDERGWRFQWGDPPRDPWSRGDPRQWERNLEHLGVRYLCVYRVPDGAGPESGFPVERAWAERGPRPLRLVWQRPWARIYAVEGQAESGARNEDRRR